MKRQAFTLLELLMVISILAVLLSIAFISLGRWRANLELQQATQVFMMELDRARSDARRTSANQQITWTADSLTIVSGGSSRNVRFSEAGSVKLSAASGGSSLTYRAPYGSLGIGNYEFRLSGRFKQEMLVYVYGVTGKVVAGAP